MTTDITASEPFDDDPVRQLPAVIEPGEFGLTLPGTGFDGEPVTNSVWFTWNGGREVDWTQDISPDYSGSPFGSASSPVRGTASWPDGRNVDITYRSTAFDLDGDDFFSNAAPTRHDPTSDDGMRDPAQWVHLAQRLNDFVTDLLHSL